MAQLGQGRLQRARQEAPDHDAGRLGIGVGKEDGELVATDPKWQVNPADRGLHQAAEFREGSVALGVAVLVVDGLERIEVDQHKGNRHAIPLGMLYLAVELFLEGAMVAKRGERVLERLRHRSLVASLELGARRNQRRDDRGLKDHPDGHHRQHRRDASLQDDVVEHDPQAQVDDHGRRRARSEGQHEPSRESAKGLAGAAWPRLCLVGHVPLVGTPLDRHRYRTTRCARALGRKYGCGRRQGRRGRLTGPIGYTHAPDARSQPPH